MQVKMVRLDARRQRNRARIVDGNIFPGRVEIAGCHSSVLQL